MTKEEIKAYNKAYREANKDILKAKKDANKAKIAKQKKEYREANKAKIAEYNMLYNKNNQDTIKAYREANKDKKKLADRLYSQTNKAKISEYRKNKYSTDIIYNLKVNLRNMIKDSLYKVKAYKGSKTETILGCSYSEFKEHIESQFEDWMSWGNKGNPKDGIFAPNKTWDIDHIIPLDSGKTKEDILKLNHYTNLRPFCSYVNRFIKRANQ